MPQLSRGEAVDPAERSDGFLAVGGWDLTEEFLRREFFSTPKCFFTGRTVIAVVIFILMVLKCVRHIMDRFHRCLAPLNRNTATTRSVGLSFGFLLVRAPT